MCYKSTDASLVLLAYQPTLEQSIIRRRGAQNSKLVRVQTKNFQSVLYKLDKPERYQNIMNIHASDKTKKIRQNGLMIPI